MILPRDGSLRFKSCDRYRDEGPRGDTLRHRGPHRRPTRGAISDKTKRRPGRRRPVDPQTSDGTAPSGGNHFSRSAGTALFAPVRLGRRRGERKRCAARNLINSGPIDARRIKARAVSESIGHQARAGRRTNATGEAALFRSSRLSPALFDGPLSRSTGVISINSRRATSARAQCGNSLIAPRPGPLDARRRFRCQRIAS